MELNLTGESVEEDELIPNSNHLCWIYDNDFDRTGIVKPFMWTHLSRRHRCMLMMSRSVADDFLDSCRKDDMGIDRYLESGQLVVVEPEAVIFAGGPFDTDVIIHRFREAWTQALADGWKRLAVVGDNAELLDRVDERDWLALEFRADFECMTQPCSMLCLYDARKASGTFIASIIKVHPVVGLGRGLARNPFYGRQIKEML